MASALLIRGSMYVLVTAGSETLVTRTILSIVTFLLLTTLHLRRRWATLAV